MGTSVSRQDVRYSLAVPIPALDPNGMLPAGVHGTTLPDIELAFGLQTPRRVDLFEKLGRFVGVAQGFALFAALYVDGSFVTDKPDPRDIDAVLEMPRNNLAGLLAHPNRLAILDGAAVKAAYEVHLFIQPPPLPMVDFFQAIRPAEALARRVPANHMRGILKVDL